MSKFKSIRFPIVITALFLFIDYAKKFPFSLSAEFDSFSGIADKILSIISPSLVLGAYTWMLWYLYEKSKHVKTIFLQFIVPLAIVMFTLGTGTYGFKQIAGFDFGDAFFAAANLLTLNASVFRSFLGTNEMIQTNLWIENARMAGGIFLGYAFFWALFTAMGRENFSRIKFWWYRNSKKQSPFQVVIGDGEKAISLALDLEKEGKRVAFLHQGFGEYTENIIAEKKIWYLKGNASSKTGLEKTYFQEAGKVYVLNDSDEENFRTIQEMDEIMGQTPHKTNAQWFVHLTDLRKKSLLTTFVSRYIQTFDINQNIARRLINENPINRFENGSTIAQVIIVGFGQLAEAIVMQCLRIGHFTGERHLQIKVYFMEKDQENVKHFQQAHPELFKDEGVSGEKSLIQEVQHYTFFQHAETIIEFEKLPIAESELVNPNFSLYPLINSKNCVSLYSCLDSGIDNAAFLGTVLPRLSWEKQKDDNRDVKVFCHYNFPDQAEQKVVQDKLNKITETSVEVLCFGNYLEECMAKHIENAKLDLLAKQIGLMYEKVHSVFDDESQAKALEELKNWNLQGIEQKWQTMKEADRESNRQAADHAWVKFRELGKNPKNIPDDLIHYWTTDELTTLSKLEHRRWNAEKLLLGWLPIKDEESWKTHKEDLKKQKLHLFLVSYNVLEAKYKNEIKKDYTQVLGLPFFMKALEI